METFFPGMFRDFEVLFVMVAEIRTVIGEAIMVA